MSRLLIINCPSEYFVNVPMGTFGICDYLSQKNIEARILNLALYNLNSNPPVPPFSKGGHINNKTEMEKVIDHYLDLFNPTHVGLVFHWQETAEGFIWVGEYIKSISDQIKIISGGFTAGYFRENLLERCRFVDYVIKGDPEKPLEVLLTGDKLPEIPNLIYRNNNGKISHSTISYFIDPETISCISFCTVAYLYDHKLYLNAIEEKLGFPIFIGRGCSYHCDYCGGSCDSFKLHSGRTKQVVRSIDSIIADLKRLKDFTRKIYICYENNRGYIKELFKAMRKEKALVKAFHLNYGAWKLFDRELLELYKDLFILDREDKPLFELSPEVFDDDSRKKIKHHDTAYSIKDLRENLFLINNHFGNSVNVSLFFSRYHDTHRTYLDMRKEIVGILRFKHELLCNNMTNMNVHYDHLSTDVASRYWERYVENPRDFDTLISSLRKLKAQEQYSFPIDNLCLYIPETLSHKEVFKCELLISILKNFEQHFYELFHILLNCLDEQIIVLLEEIISEVYLKRSGNVFKNLDCSELLDYVKVKIMKRKSHLSKIPFIEDLINLNIKKAIFLRTPIRPQPSRSLYQTSRPRLNNAFISVNEHDYLDLQNFLKKLEQKGQANLTPEKTVFFFLANEILSMPYITYRVTVKEFEKGISLDEYYVLMNRRGIFDISYHKEIIEKLFESYVLY